MDQSLSPRADSYLDRGNESARIIGRIENSSSMVLGIAGPRGSGKSSLALKVLKVCAEKGHFTILISAPTKYDPREFLLTVFRRCAEEAVRIYEEKTDQLLTLSGLGLRDMKRAARRNTIVSIGIVAVLLVALVFSLSFARQESQKRQAADLDLQLSRDSLHLIQLTSDIASIDSVKQLVLSGRESLRDSYQRKVQSSSFASHGDSDLRRSVWSNSDTAARGLLLKVSAPEAGYVVARTVIPLIEALQQLEKAQNSDLPLGPEDPNWPVLGSLRRVMESENVGYLEGQLILLSQRLDITKSHLDSTRHSFGTNYAARRRNRQDFDAPHSTLIGGTINFASNQRYVLLGILLLLSLTGGIVYLALRRAKTVRVSEIDPALRGLYISSKRAIEEIDYYTSHAASKEFGIVMGRVTAKISRGRTLSAKDRSLPGITADCCSYLTNASEVFGNKLIVCLDELDKIESAESLSELLRGVKGVLGQAGTYFVMTVSNDALSRFYSLEGSQKDLLESCFDDVISLDFLKFSLSMDLMCAMLSKAEQARLVQVDRSLIGSVGLNSLTTWILARGIPREMKRAVIRCTDDRLPLTTDEARAYWGVQFEYLKRSCRTELQAMSNAKEINDEIVLELIDFIETMPMQATAPGLRPIDHIRWYSSALDYARQKFQPGFLCADAGSLPPRAEEILFNVLLAASCVWLIGGDRRDHGVQKEIVEAFQRILEDTFISARIAGRRLVSVIAQLEPRLYKGSALERRPA